MPKVTTEQVVGAYQNHGGNIQATAQSLGVSRACVYYHLKKAGIDRTKKIVDGSVRGVEAVKCPLPKSGEIKRYILTSAQNNTHVHTPVWKSLLALAKHYNAEIMVGTFTYNQNAFGKLSVKRGKDKSREKKLWYDQKVVPYIVDKRHLIANHLCWCGEMNILPTAVRPLTGFDSYTGRSSAIFPQVKFAMESIATGRKENTKFNYTTGTVTQRNYIQKREGLKAEFHHCFHPDTEFMTTLGIKTFRETVGQTVRVWSGTAWEYAEIKSFGEQELNEILFVPAIQQGNFYRAQNSKLSHTIKATAQHTWHLSDGGITNNLSVGDVIPTSTLSAVNEGPDFEAGVRHGLIFGDGSVIYRSSKTKEYNHQLCVHGEVAGEWLHLFDKITQWPSRTHIANYKGTVYYKSGHNMKELPTDKNPKYIRGFFVGWLAADGHLVKRDGSIQLCSITKYAIDWAVKMAPYAGFVATGLCRGGGDITTFGERRKPLWRLTLTDTPRYWKVCSITKIPPNEVMCAVVYPSHKFTLAGGILTGNCYGAVIVEVDSDGNWWLRQLNATDKGTIYDLDVVVENGVVYENEYIEAITWGDAHALMLLDESVNKCSQLMLDELRPKFQFVHDLMAGSVTNHHSRKSLHQRFRNFARSGAWNDLKKEFSECNNHLRDMYRDFCQTYVVDANHDRPWIERWLDSREGLDDPKNALIWLKLNAALYEAMEADPYGRNFHALEYACRLVGLEEKVATFLREDESIHITDAKIECGMHGSLGPNGARGNMSNLSRMGRKANIGHLHKAGIHDGLYVAGVSCDIKSDVWYTRGPSSWSHSHIVTYPNGKRTIITVWKGKYRA